MDHDYVRKTKGLYELTAKGERELSGVSTACPPQCPLPGTNVLRSPPSLEGDGQGGQDSGQDKSNLFAEDDKEAA